MQKAKRIDLGDGSLLKKREQDSVTSVEKVYSKRCFIFSYTLQLDASNIDIVGEIFYKSIYIYTLQLFSRDTVQFQRQTRETRTQ